MPSLSLRIQLDPEGRIGPGKIELLEKIAALGSISASTPNTISICSAPKSLRTG